MPKVTTYLLFLLIAVATSRLDAQRSDGVDLAAMQGWDIVVSEDAIPSETYAAEEFQTFFARAAGVRVPIVSSIDGPERHVFIGPGRRHMGAGVSVPNG